MINITVSSSDEEKAKLFKKWLDEEGYSAFNSYCVIKDVVMPGRDIRVEIERLADSNRPLTLRDNIHDELI